MALPYYGDRDKLAMLPEFNSSTTYGAPIKGSGYNTNWESNPTNYTPPAPQPTKKSSSSSGSGSSYPKAPTSSRGGLSKSEYKAKYGVEWDDGGASEEEERWREIEKMREQQKSATNNQFDKLLESLGLQYEGYETKGKKAFDERQLEDIQALTRRHKAYGTLDSESRDQANERTSSSYADKFTEFLDTLSGQRAGQLSNIGAARAEALAAIDRDRASDAYQRMVMENQQAQQAFENQLATQAAAASGRAVTSSGQDAATYAFQRAQELISGGEHAYATPHIADMIANETAAMFGVEKEMIRNLLETGPGWEEKYYRPEAPSGNNFGTLPLGATPMNRTTGELGQSNMGGFGTLNQSMMTDEQKLQMLLDSM